MQIVTEWKWSFALLWITQKLILPHENSTKTFSSAKNRMTVVLLKPAIQSNFWVWTKKLQKWWLASSCRRWAPQHVSDLMLFNHQLHDSSRAHNPLHHSFHLPSEVAAKPVVDSSKYCFNPKPRQNCKTPFTRRERGRENAHTPSPPLSLCIASLKLVSDLA